MNFYDDQAMTTRELFEHYFPRALAMFTGC